MSAVDLLCDIATPVFRWSSRLGSAGAFRIFLLHDVPRAQYQALARVLDLIGDFLTPDDALSRIELGVGRDGRYLLSFDDGFIGNREVAERVLAPRGIKAVFFVCPGLIDLPASRRREAVAAHVYEGSMAPKKLPPDPVLMGWDDLEALLRAGHAIGGHTLVHKRLAGLAPEMLEEQVGGSAEQLTSHLGVALAWFAYPFGDINSIDANALRAIGRHYRVCRSGVRGWNRPGGHRLALLADHLDLMASVAWQDLVVAGGLDMAYVQARARLLRLADAVVPEFTLRAPTTVAAPTRGLLANVVTAPSHSEVSTFAASTGPRDGIPTLVFIGNSCPPYRAATQLRVAHELPQIKVFSLFTHGAADDALWTFAPPAEIRPRVFGTDPVATQGQARYALRDWRKGGRIIRWLRDNNVRAVIASGYNDLCLIRVSLWCRRNSVPCFLWADSNVRSEFTTRWRSLLKRVLLPRILRACAGVLVFGSLGAAYFRNYGVGSDRLFAVPVVPDFNRYTAPSETAIRHARARFRLPAGRRRFVFSGRLVDTKRVDLLIDAFTVLADERPEWDLLIVGDGPLGDALQQRVPKRLRGRVASVGFIDDDEVVGALFNLADVLVLPSDREQWGVVVSEAAAAGLALVVSDVVGVGPELVKVGENGYVFQRGDAGDLLRCLRLITDPLRIDGMKAASRQLLTAWRSTSDPVAGLRHALQFVGLLPGTRCK